MTYLQEIAKMKYYYNGQRIRTSENEYNYALLFVGKDGTYKTCKCSNTYDACEKELNYKTKAETIANQLGQTIEEVYKSRKYKLCSSQLFKRENYIIVKLEKVNA